MSPFLAIIFLATCPPQAAQPSQDGCFFRPNFELNPFSLYQACYDCLDVIVPPTTQFHRRIPLVLVLVLKLFYCLALQSKTPLQVLEWIYEQLQLPELE